MDGKGWHEEKDLLAKIKGLSGIVPQMSIFLVHLTSSRSKIVALDHEARLHDELFRARQKELMAGLAPGGGAGL